MSKILAATCENSIVTVEGKEVEAEILSEGQKSSEGIVLIKGNKVVYISSSALDIKEVIEKLVQIVGKISEISLGIDSVTNSPGGQAAGFAELNTLKTELNLIKDNLI